MINLLTESISRALNGEFGDEYEIYREEVRQGLKEPCFFITCINPSVDLLRCDRYSRKNQFCIQYLPEPGGDEREACHAAAERMLSCLRWLDCEGVPVMGTGMRYEVSDSILHFFVNYNTFSDRAQRSFEPMEELTDQVSVKGEMGR